MKNTLLLMLFTFSLYAQTTINGRRAISGAVNAQTTTYQVLTTDFNAPCGTIPVASGTFTITLVASGSQPPAGQCVDVINYGSGVVTIARSGQNINGGTASITLAAGSASAPTSAHVISDGTNYEIGFLPAAAGLGLSSYYITSGGNYYIGPNMALATLPIVGNYSFLSTQGGATFAASGDAALLTIPSNNGNQLRVAGFNMSANTQITVGFSCTQKSVDFHDCGVLLKESSTGKYYKCVIDARTSGMTYRTSYWSDQVGTSITSAYTSPAIGPKPIWWIRVIQSGGNVTCSISDDGTNFVQIATVAQTTPFTTAANQWGVGGVINENGGTSNFFLVYSVAVQ